MWGSLRSAAGSTFGDVQNTISPSSPQGDNASLSSQQTGGGSIFGGISARPRPSITSVLSGSAMSTNLELETAELDSEAVTHIDSFFDRFWAEISVFSFERAKEIAEKEKEFALKGHTQATNCASFGFTWVILTTSMSQLALIEKGYVSLAFFAPNSFLRKGSNLKTILETIRHDLKKIVESGVTSPAKHMNSQIATCLTLFINLRLEQMEFYDRLSVFGTSKNVEIGDLISDIEVIYEKFRDELKTVGEGGNILRGILKTLQWENEILISLLKSMSMMQMWDYLGATIALQQANNQLQEWSEILQNHSTTFKKSAFYNSPPSYPQLFLWIKKLKGALVSKYSVYFNELLAKNSNPSFDLKSYCCKLPVDYYGRMLSFQKKSDAISVSIIFDSKDTKYNPEGYSCVGREIPVAQGLDSFPAVLSIPTKPGIHWPNIVMIISDRQNELNVDKLVGFFDSSMQATYFVQRIDPKMFLVVIYESKKSEKDAYTVKFMSELTMDLKCGRIFSSLKNTK